MNKIVSEHHLNRSRTDIISNFGHCDEILDFKNISFQHRGGYTSIDTWNIDIWFQQISATERCWPQTKDIYKHIFVLLEAAIYIISFNQWREEYLPNYLIKLVPSLVGYLLNEAFSRHERHRLCSNKAYKPYLLGTSSYYHSCLQKQSCCNL